jgi:ribonuclease HI
MVYGDDFEPIRRLYDPIEDRCCWRIPHDELVVYNAEKGISHKQGQNVYGKREIYTDTMSMIVFIDGACRGNGTATARASYGVFFGAGSPFNTYGLLPSALPQTSTRAEIEALSQALKTIEAITDKDYSLTRIKIATDSSFLVDAMSRHVERWIKDKGLRANGKEKVVHFEAMKQLHEKLDYMEFSDAGGREIMFWHVPRELNREADALANKALNEL